MINAETFRETNMQIVCILNIIYYMQNVLNYDGNKK